MKKEKEEVKESEEKNSTRNRRKLVKWGKNISAFRGQGRK